MDAVVIFPWNDRSPLVDELRRQLEAERERTERLVNAIVEMKRDGFTMPAQVADMSSDFTPIPGEVEDAIATRGLTRQAREKLTRQAQRMLRDADAEAVRQRILEGEPFGWGL